MRLRVWLQMMAAVMTGILVAWAVGWTVGRLSMTLGMFAVGLAVAYVMDPVLDWLERRRLTRGQAVGVVVLTTLILLALGISWVVPAVVTQAKDVAQNYPKYVTALEEAIGRGEVWLRAWAGARWGEQQVADLIQGASDKALAWLQSHASQGLTFVATGLLASTRLVTWLIIVSLISIQFMVAIDVFKRSIRQLLPDSSAEGVQDVGRKVSAMLARYVVGQFTLCVIMGLLTGAGLFVLGQVYGTKYAILIGLVAGVLYVIPWIGAFATNVIAVVTAYVTAGHDPLYAAAATLVTITISNFICDNLLTPRVLGQKIGLHPLVVFFALLSGSQLFGIWGMILATPLAASIKIVLARWLPLKEPEETGRRGPRALAFDLERVAHIASEHYDEVRHRIKDAIQAEVTADGSVANRKEETGTDDDSAAT